MRSLRGQLTFFWLTLLTVSSALVIVILVLLRSGENSRIETVQQRAMQACDAISHRYEASLAQPGLQQPQVDLLQVLLQLVLIETPRVEGGVWREGNGFLAYAYPTYEGSAVKRDVPQAEQAHLTELAHIVARTQRPQTDVVRGSREALVVAACPLSSPQNDLVAWTMTRTSGASLDVQQLLRTGLAALLAFVLASGLWLGFILVRGYRQVQRLEQQLARVDVDGVVQPLGATGIQELDRIVAALNAYRGRLEETRLGLRQATAQRSRDQRLAALGRMTGGVAHEIRNPIAAMRLKAENALAGPPARQPAALQSILGQIERLDALVKSLLALVQPVQLQLQLVELDAWVHEHAAAFQARADDRNVELHVQAEALAAQIDPVHLGRALDNLLDNAVRHASSTVGVTLHRDRGKLLIEISDDGGGIDDALQDQLFEPFASGRANGTGLGLALAREVALAHEGDIYYVALSPGARFDLELPWRMS